MIPLSPPADRFFTRPPSGWWRHARTVLALALLSLPLPAQSAAATTLKDIQVGVRGIQFLTDPPHGRVPVVIITDHQNKSAEHDAQAIESWLATASPPKVELAAEVVDVRDLDHVSGVHIAVVSIGLEGFYERIQAFSRRNGALTISADLACVRSGSCVLGVATEPTVEVILSRQATQDSGLDFVRAFRMMVKEY